MCSIPLAEDNSWFYEFIFLKIGGQLVNCSLEKSFVPFYRDSSSQKNSHLIDNYQGKDQLTKDKNEENTNDERL